MPHSAPPTAPVTAPLSFGYSPCPNDTYIFHALTHGLVTAAAGDQALPAIDVRLADIDELNRATMAGELDVAKISYHAYGHLAADYVLLRSGGALGRGVGPLLVARDAGLDLAGKRVAIPGGLTTANLLLALMRDDLQLVTLRYDRIMPAVAAGEVDAGLIIHESRFTYQDHGLTSLVDLGTWWEHEVGHLVPLGAIVARRSLGANMHDRLSAAIRASLSHAHAHPDASAAYVAANAQEMSADVRRRHIELYVNDHSFDVGQDGEAAVRELLHRGVRRGLFPAVPEPLFAGNAPSAGHPGGMSVAGSVTQG